MNMTAIDRQTLETLVAVVVVVVVLDVAVALRHRQLDIVALSDWQTNIRALLETTTRERECDCECECEWSDSCMKVAFIKNNIVNSNE